MFIFYFLFQSPDKDLIWGFIPPIVFSGVLSAIISAGIVILATFLQNRASDKRQDKMLKDQAKQQKERLDHEAAERRKDRQMNMRRDIYLEGAEAMGKMESYFFVYFNLSENIQQSKLEGVNEAVNKMGLISDFETIKALNDLQMFFGDCLMELSEKRIKLDWLIENQKSYEPHFNSLQEQINLKQNLVIGLNPQKDWQTILNIVNEQEMLRKELEKLRQSWYEGQCLVGQELVEIQKAAVQSQMKFLRYASELNALIRKEIDIPLDETNYIALIDKTVEEREPKVIEWFENINNDVRKRFDSQFQPRRISSSD